MSDILTRIENPNSSEYVSELLRLTIQNVENMGVQSKVVSKPLADKKSSLIIEIAVGLGVSATWDILKFVGSVLNKSRRAQAGDEIILNGKRYLIAEIDDEGLDDPQNHD